MHNGFRRRTGPPGGLHQPPGGFSIRKFQQQVIIQPSFLSGSFDMTARIKEPTLLQTTLILTVLVKMAAGAVSGAEFRLSFLDEAPVLADTCQLLKETGFSEESVATFKKLVEQHNKWGTRSGV